MNFISDLLTAIDNGVVEAFGSDELSSVVSVVGPLFKVMAVFAVALTAIFLVTQIRRTEPLTIFALIIRIAVIGAFALDPDNILSVYNVLTNAPSRLGLVIIGTSGEANLYSALDQYFANTLSAANQIAKNGGLIAGPLAAVVVMLAAVSLSVSSVLVIGLAKMMLGVLCVLAPATIILSMFERTSFLFEGWLRLVIGYSLTSLLASGVIVIVLKGADAVGGNILVQSPENFADLMGVIVICLCGVFLMLQVPNIASAISNAALSIAPVAGVISGIAFKSATALPKGLEAAKTAGTTVHSATNSAANFLTTPKK